MAAQQNKTFYDSDELMMICESMEVKSTLEDMRQELILYSKSGDIDSEITEIVQIRESFNSLSEIVNEFSKNSCYSFFNKYGFFTKKEPLTRSFNN